MGQRSAAKAYGCTGKQRHLTKIEAQAHLESLFHRFGYKGRVYHCQFCGCFHVGRRHQKRR